MAGITYESAQAQLQEYLAAEAAILHGQAFSRAGKSLTMADLATVQAGIKTWNQRCQELAPADEITTAPLRRMRVMEVIPR
ncbi:MAG: hypothetical protein LBU39_01040 [Desulfobulbaceae bacterium]|jgi:hypothetical protein|nr:hypothetical protein [Desulfobulbaceae bacterium]